MVRPPSWPGVHGLQHVQGLAAADLADDDPVGPHAEGVDHQVAGGDQAAALDVLRPRLHPHDVLLVENQFGGVLDGYDPLAVGNGLGQRAEQRRLARARAAGNEHVLPAAHDGVEKES